MRGPDLSQVGHLDPAAVDRDRATGMEHAARRRVERARHLAAEHHALALGLRAGSGIGTAESSAFVYGCSGVS